MRFLLILLYLAVAFALAIVEQTTITNEVPRIVLVELTERAQQNPDIVFNIIEQRLFEHECIFTRRHTFSSSLFRGFSFGLSCEGDREIVRSKILPMIQSLDVVKKASFASRSHQTPQRGQQRPQQQHGALPGETSHIVKRQATTTANSGLYESPTLPTHNDTGVSRLHAEGTLGNGINIAVIDTGFDLASPGLSQTRVTYNYNYVEDAFNFTGDNCINFLHGTHVLGIIAAESEERKFGVVGVAPNVTVELYGLDPCEGAAPGGLDDLMAAIESASSKGVDLIMIGYGIGLAFEEEPVARLVSQAVANGTAVTVASGNAGPGLFTGGSPANARGAAAIGSADNSATPYYTWQANFTSGNDTGFVRYAPQFPANFPAGNNLTLWSPGPAEGLPEGCNPAPGGFVPPADPAHTIMLIEEDHCWLSPGNTSTRLALGLGIPYVLRYQSASASVVDGMQWRPGFAEYSRDYKGIARISNEDGLFLASLLSNGSSVRISVPSNISEAHEEVFYRDNDISGGFVSGFSSWGPTPEGKSYPSFIAPGENILSTFLPRYGGVAVVGGTSMSNPFAVGVYALVKERHPDYDPQQILAVVASTAKPVRFIDDARQRKEFLAPVFSQGGGLVDAWDAVHTASLVNVSSLDFNDTAHRPEALTLSLKNTGTETLKYELRHLGAASGYILSETDPYGLSGAEGHPAYADVDISPAEVELAPGRSISISVSVRSNPSLPATSRGIFFGGYIEIVSSASEANTLTVPYTGFGTPLVDIPMINPNASHLVKVNTDTQVDTEVPPDTLFTCLFNGTIPKPAWPVTCDLGFPGFRKVFVTASREYTYDLVSAETGEDVLAGTFRGSAGNWAAPSSWWVWDGSEEDRKYVPPGSYFWRVRALRLNGDAGRAGDWDVWESGRWRLAYDGRSVGLPENATELPYNSVDAGDDGPALLRRILAVETYAHTKEFNFIQVPYLFSSFKSSARAESEGPKAVA
ncbi:serine endopeptidase [Colletotrichum costaricense]|uniref:Serine endopeptidase n=1 Tax=Colletotrichum costaricense TaxID=1209916 RepID=A0AAI9Z2C1_9PEZI|nr:serine endopeptidase [Colletotrichum costaricense]KAK1532448.1 serine endopeptidase [Colletotrichum costaricense]